MVSTTDLEFDARSAGAFAPTARPGDRRLALGRLSLGTAFVLGCVAMIMSALSSNAPLVDNVPTHRDAMIVTVLAASILLAVTGLAAVICGWFAARAVPSRADADRAI